MPFKSKAQMRAAFSGALGPKMKADAEQWAHETPNISKLPDHVRKGIKHDRTMREVHKHLTGGYNGSSDK